MRSGQRRIFDGSDSGMALNPTELFDMTRSGLNRIQQAISIYDDQLRLAISNRRFQEMFGLPDHLVAPGAAFADTIRFLADAGDYGQIDDVETFIKERVDQALTFEPHYIERTRASGMVVSIEGGPVRQGGWVTVYTDITTIKEQESLLRSRSAELSGQLLDRSEELSRSNRELAAANSALEDAKRDLTESEARARMTAEMTPAHIARVDLDGRYTYSNRKLPEILPDAPMVVIGMEIAEALGPEAYSHVQPYLNAAHGGRASVFEFDVESRTRRLRCAFTPDATDGVVSGVYILSTDVTEEARARAALTQSRKRELAAQLASGLAHDFSNLLTIIVGLQGQIERQENIPDEVRDLVATTKDAALRGGDLLDRLADISGAREIQPKPVRIDDLFENLLSLAKAAVPNGITLEFGNAGPKFPVLLDPGFTQDALLNLILNASDAMDGRGKITISARQNGRQIEFEVSDEGPGFTAVALDRAIDPFFTTKARGKGSGLGLTMVYDFAKMCGGRVWFGNAKAGGAYVVISVRLAQTPARRAPGLVLLVEDNEEIRLSIRTMLREDGHKVLEANTAEEALDLADLPDISIVLTDIMLGGRLTGFDLATRLSENKKDVAIGVITGLPRSDPLRQSVEARFPVLRKPFGADALRTFLDGQIV